MTMDAISDTTKTPAAAEDRLVAWKRGSAHFTQTAERRARLAVKLCADGRISLDECAAAIGAWQHANEIAPASDARVEDARAG